MDASCSFLVVVVRKMVAVVVVVQDGHSNNADDDSDDEYYRGYHHCNVEDCGGVFHLLLLRRRLLIRCWLDIETKIMVDSSMITMVEDNRGNMTRLPGSARARARVDTAGGWSDHPVRVFHDQTHLSS